MTRTRHTGRRLTAALQHLKPLTERLRTTETSTGEQDTGVNLQDTQLQHGNGPEARKLARLKKQAWDAESPVQTRRGAS